MEDEMTEGMHFENPAIMGSSFISKRFMLDKLPRIFQNSASPTDLNQAEDISPLGSLPFPGPVIRGSTLREKKVL